MRLSVYQLQLETAPLFLPSLYKCRFPFSIPLFEHADSGGGEGGGGGGVLERIGPAGRTMQDSGSRGGGGGAGDGIYGKGT